MTGNACMNQFQSSSVLSLMYDFYVVTLLICTTDQCRPGAKVEKIRVLLWNLQRLRKAICYIQFTSWASLSTLLASASHTKAMWVVFPVPVQAECRAKSCLRWNIWKVGPEQAHLISGCRDVLLPMVNPQWLPLNSPKSFPVLEDCVLETQDCICVILIEYFRYQLSFTLSSRLLSVVRVLKILVVKPWNLLILLL